MRRLPLLLLALCLLLGGCGARREAPEAEAPTPKTVESVSPPPAPAHPYEPLRVYFDGLLTDRGYVRNGRAYLAPETVCAYYGLDSETTTTAEGFTLTIAALTVEGREGRPYLLADGRCLYAPEGWVEADGRLYLPADAIERIFGLRVTLSEDLRTAEIGNTGFRLLSGGEGYYERTTQADDLYWLTHLIYAEAHHEPLEGQIGVGNVVLNRVADDKFPSTITSVVLDREHTIQFAPVASGEITAEPDENARLAAYLCLEGYNTAGDSLYFVNPARGDPGWFQRDLTQVCVIGSHYFYK